MPQITPVGGGGKTDDCGAQSFELLGKIAKFALELRGHTPPPYTSRYFYFRMSKVNFQVSYEIKPEKRDAFLKLAGQLRREMLACGLNYGIYQLQGAENTYTEIFVCDSTEEFDALEDKFSDSVQMLIDKLSDMIVDGKMRYATLNEIGG